MGLRSDLESEVSKIFRESWDTCDGTVVPDDSAIKLGNHGKIIDATVLYADLQDSTALVDNSTPEFAAEIYKTYLVCAARIIRMEGGEITAYDGDRIMAVYVGSSKNTAAVRSALKINWAVRSIVNPKLQVQYPSRSYEVKQVVGVDTSKLLVAKTGIRSYNDLVWVGKAANYAAKLSSLNNFSSYITDRVYDNMASEAKFANGIDMWQPRTWNAQGNMRIYGSTYSWALS